MSQCTSTFLFTFIACKFNAKLYVTGLQPIFRRPKIMRNPMIVMTPFVMTALAAALAAAATVVDHVSKLTSLLHSTLYLTYEYNFNG